MVKEDKFEIFVEITKTLSSTLNPDELLELTMDSVNRLVESEGSSLLLIDEDANRLYFKVVTGPKAKEVKRFTLRPGEGIVGWVIQTGTPLLVSDPMRDPRHKREISLYLEEEGFVTRSIICVPLKVFGKVVGAIEAVNKVGKDAFDDEDLKLLMALAGHVSLFLRNARIYDEISRENLALRQSQEPDYKLIFASEKMAKIYELLKKVAITKATVLLLGESGTGKELIAREIHRLSPRAEKPFITVNCSAIPETLLESELFGYEKGAFTGATSRKLGRFELANKGTIFLDEICEMSPALQSKLLRVLQEREFERLGGEKTIKVDIRIIAATNKDIEKEVKEGRFREDLYYRLNVFRIEVPPLRERKEDIIPLAHYFLEKFSKELGKRVPQLSDEAVDLLLSYEWPGNVRELQNAMERAVVLSSGPYIFPEHLSIRVGEAEPLPNKRWDEVQRDFKRMYLTKVLIKTGWNRKRAAEILGIRNTYLSRLIRELGIRKGEGYKKL